jgi:decaprenylphospho-beta-D-ribofuranose 2-oxidase
MKVTGWGRLPSIDVPIHRLETEAEVADLVASSTVTLRGNGRSYGDSSLGEVIGEMLGLKSGFALNDSSGLLECDAGFTIDEILRISIPRGWFVPVVPGTAYVTVGGAIAADVHGKNHHLDGTFSNFVESMRIMLGSGDIVTASRNSHADLFHATCGGMGLTGAILSARIRLIPISSGRIVKQTIKLRGIRNILDSFDANHSSRYSVAWVDGTAQNPENVRAVLMLGHHSDKGVLADTDRTLFDYPLEGPASLLRKDTVRLFNRLYFLGHRDGMKSMHSRDFFFPLDKIGGWNRIYGRDGMIQYQFVAPLESAEQVIGDVMTTLSKFRVPSLLSVLKKFGAENSNLLSFPKEGYSLAMDFKMSAQVVDLIRVLDEIVISNSGRINLCKDSLMSSERFRQCYPKFEEFESVRERYGAIGKFASAQSKRIGLS